MNEKKAIDIGEAVDELGTAVLDAGLAITGPARHRSVTEGCDSRKASCLTDAVLHVADGLDVLANVISRGLHVTVTVKHEGGER